MLYDPKDCSQTVKTVPSERSLSEQAKKLREAVERVDEEIQRLESFGTVKFPLISIRSIHSIQNH